jgi:hypothetical protein
VVGQVQERLLTRIAATTEGVSWCALMKILSAFLERQVLTVTFYLESIHADALQIM